MSFLSKGVNWLKSQFEESPEEDSYEEQERDEGEDVPAAGALPARSIRPQEVDIMVPGSYGDARRAVDALARGMTVIVVLNDNLDDAVMKTESIIRAEGLRVPDKIMPVVRKYEEEE